MTTLEEGADAAAVAAHVRAHDVAVTKAERAAAEAALAALDVHRLVVEQGDPVDPARHHVVATVPSDPTRAPMSVVEVVRPGWTGPQGIIRPSEVRAAVAAAP